MIKTNFLLAYFFSCYLVQGVALTYYLNFQKPYLSNLGVSLDNIGLVSSVMLMPFVAKIAIGFLSDRFSFFGLGHRKPYVVIGILLGASSFVMVSFVDPLASFNIFLITMVLASMGLATIDAVTDGMAVEEFSDSQAGRVQATMMVGRSFGLLFGAWILGTYFKDSSDMYKVIGMFFLFPALALFLLPKSLGLKKVANASPSFSFKIALVPMAILALVHTLFSMGSEGVVTLSLVNHKGFSTSDVGTFAIFKPLGSILAALIFGYFSKKYKVRDMGRFTFFICSALMASTAIFWDSWAPSLAPQLGFAWGFGIGLVEITFVAVAMTHSHFKSTAVVFASWMAMANIGAAVGNKVWTGLLKTQTPSAVFFICALGILVTWWTYDIFNRSFKKTAN